ncbi:hypothetical protein MPTK1_4g04570 [Marchantia polymorpha subsp. ruderalis]|uniref:Protein-S-isoprenylcysteine O-methyltransferase n=2 Tax=Marchantia polymorpha TaxID=3197 RepID=A0AAF6B6C9_MARPO|nr:hypothetical protein MARPO_0044s0017 [Marchantia polymorpha]BBN07563.1 hypothetical protein Mp_4g04570 [Marchantia polymorpha subsp. ruderalis]|eukprot:PTQ39537.1 hypothetical protein MARPO_0044s0017 [Marchantia polymorpha]
MASALLASRHSFFAARGPSSSTGLVLGACSSVDSSVCTSPAEFWARKAIGSGKGSGNWSHDSSASFVRVRSSQEFGNSCRLSESRRCPLPSGFSLRLRRKVSGNRSRNSFEPSENGREGAPARAYFGHRESMAREDESGAESKRITLPILGELPFDVPDIGEITPKKVAIWAALAALVYATLNFIASRTVFNPKFWTYASWILVVWPMPTAVILGLASLVTAFRVTKRKPKEWEQVLLLVGSLVWLILVPVGRFQGFVDGWPTILFSLYAGFFLISAVVRYRLYGDLSSKAEDKQWANTTSRSWQVGFVASVAAGHWLAAWEAPFLALSWNFGPRSQLAAAVLVLAVVTHYNAAYYLGKYFDRLVKPRAVVMFGPYRWVRHPIYASYMLLFVGYCLALRSYKSLVFMLAACIAYYEQRTKIEEEQLVDTFGELYTGYVERVQNKYFPFLY